MASVPLEAKADEINLVLSEPDVDLWKLRELALTQGGLVNDTLRKRAWPKLVGLHDFWEPTTTVGAKETNNKSLRGRPPVAAPPSAYNLRPRPPRTNNENSENSTAAMDADDMSVTSTASSATNITTASTPLVCLDAQQIDRDVARCTWHLLTGNQRAQRLQMEHKRHKKVRKLILKKQARLAQLITSTLVQSYDDDELRYYQGYHDVACIFLSTLGGTSRVRQSSMATPTPTPRADLELPSAVLLQVSQSHFRDCLRPNFIHLQTALRLSLVPLLAVLDPEVHDHLYQADMEPFFALSWILTWFAHDVRDSEAVKRLFDAFLVSHPLMPVYMAVAMVLHPINRTEVLATEPDFAQLHHVLQGLPKNSSMVGWKYRPGDGYVSDEENTDDGTVSTDALSVEGDFLWVESAAQRLDDDTQSLVSTSLSSIMEPTRVPFQELIDAAIRYMRRYPPRMLVPLATRYYGKPYVDTLLRDAPNSALLRGTPPSWALQSTAKADWVLKQRARERRGIAKTRREKRREKKRARSRSRSRGTSRTRADQCSLLAKDDETDTANDHGMIQKYLAEQNKTSPVIAVGYGPGDDDERRRRKRRKRMVYYGMAVLIVAVAVGVVAFQNRSSASSAPSALEGRGGGVEQTSRRGEANASASVETKNETALPTPPADVGKEFALKEATEVSATLDSVRPTKTGPSGRGQVRHDVPGKKEIGSCLDGAFKPHRPLAAKIGRIWNGVTGSAVVQKTAQTLKAASVTGLYDK